MRTIWGVWDGSGHTHCDGACDGSGDRGDGVRVGGVEGCLYAPEGFGKEATDRPDAELVLARHETSPETWQAPLAAVLTEAGAEHDTDLVAAAQAFMSLADNSGGRAGKYTVDTRGAFGVQVGDHNRQDNVFRATPGG